MPNSIVVIHAHPFPRQSRANSSLRSILNGLEGVEVRELYELYPDFHIDAEAEKTALIRADTVIFQHPLYWYHAPALLKHWVDVVYERGFAYGDGGDKLKGKHVMQAISIGGPVSDYVRAGYHSFALPEFLRPWEQTANFCGMINLEPFVVAGELTDEQIEKRAGEYRDLLKRMRAGHLPKTYSTVRD